MIDQELQQIARELSKEASSYSPVKVESPKGTYYDYSYLIEKAIKRILRTHCIVSREKVISEIKAAQNELNEPSKPMLKFTLGYVLGLLHNLFGTELFEERSEK